MNPLDERFEGLAGTITPDQQAQLLKLQVALDDADDTTGADFALSELQNQRYDGSPEGWPAILQYWVDGEYREDPPSATLITDLAGHVTQDSLLPIVTDDGEVGFQIAGQVCLVLDGELIDARQGPNRSWTAVAFDARHAEAAARYNVSPAASQGWDKSWIEIK